MEVIIWEKDLLKLLIRTSRMQRKAHSSSLTNNHRKNQQKNSKKMEQKAFFSHIVHLRVPTRISIVILVGTLVHIFPFFTMYIDNEI